ncbi:TELO2-interacting protein 2-like [Octopus sinensis]|uniref:TELO2-interacting protein 2-like n=1 Tax=Octopus sinensis TaxID=2607531 RepID=A0A6P7SZB2_9MOLL|nr:TELO2-interacting protein 2-like [Octopus sinensis]
MTDKLISDLWEDIVGSSASDIDGNCNLESIVDQMRQSHSFTDVIHQISIELQSCTCSPLCKLNLVVVFVQLCPEIYFECNHQEEMLIASSTKNTFSEDNDVKLLQKIVTHAYVEEFRDREIYEYTADDFPNAVTRANLVFKSFTLLLQNQKASKRIFCRNESLDLVALLCSLAASHAEPGPWTSETTVVAANSIINALAKFYSCRNSQELLLLANEHGFTNPEDSWHTKSIFRKILNLNQPRLRKENWNKNPFAKAAFCWCLGNVEHPYLSFYLDHVLTPVLLFVDDFVSEHKLTGIKYLNYIIDNVSKEELRWYNRDAVIFDALKHQLFTQEESVLETTLSSLLSILSILEKPPSKLENISYNRYDEIFTSVLYNAQIENQLSFRRVYTSYIPKFIHLMGMTVVRHTKQFLQLVESYLEIYDGPHEVARLNVLASLKSFIKVSWPRIQHHNDKLVKILLRLVYDVAVEDVYVIPNDVKQKVISEVVEILGILRMLNKERVENLLHAVSGKLNIPAFQEAVESVLNICI